MVDSDVGPGVPLYRTIWKRSDTNVLVCLHDHEIELFGTPYDVAIVNTNLQVVRWGEITASQDDTPYCIAEVMTADERLPEELRNKWLLAVGFWENPSHPYRFEMPKTVIEAEMRSSSAHKQNPQSQDRKLLGWPFREMGPDGERFYQERAIAVLRTEITKTEARVKSLRNSLSGKTGNEQMAKELDMEERILAALIMRLRVEENRDKKIEPSH